MTSTVKPAKIVKSSIKTFWVLQLLLATCAVAGFVFMSNHRSQSQAAKQRLSYGQRLAARIDHLRQDSSRQLVDLPDARLTELIERCARSAGIRSQSIRLISPQSPAPIAQSRYARKNTLVMLKDVTVKQSAELIYKLHNPASESISIDNPTPLNVLSLRLTNPNDEMSTEKWNTEVLFSQTVLLPKENNGSAQ